ncbi:MAG: 2OG-Fe(II) oxygenase [Chromatiales bacterium]|nr:2OG-Fe(II) oxygenase [Chromatiales bacterium]
MLISLHDCAPCRELNSTLVQRFERAFAAGLLRGSHHYEARDENLYWDHDRPAELEQLLDSARQFSAGRLGVDALRVRIGGWFNRAPPGSRTTAHRHDSGDEQVSGVYYLQADAGAGDLLIYPREGRRRIAPVEGRFVLFPPNLLHEVERNASGRIRLSFAFNATSIAAPPQHNAKE